MRNIFETYRGLKMIEKIGFWGSVASIISLALVFLLPTETADSQGYPGNKVEVRDSTVRGDIFGGDKIVVQTKYRDANILNNQGSPTLVIKSFPEDKNFIKHGTQQENFLGVAEVGTEVSVLETKETTLPLMKAKKILILSGDLKGETGWVSANTVGQAKLPSE
jgi:hypothetical protein